MVLPRAMLASAAVLRLVWRAALPLGLALGVINTGCGSRKEASGPPIGQTRADGIVPREFEVPIVEEPDGEDEVVAPSRQELNRIAAEREEARQAEWARTALAEVESPANDLGVVVVVAQRASDLPWLLAIQNRGERPVSVAALPDLLTFEVVPKDRAAADAAQATTTATGRATKTPPPPPPIVCGEVPKAVSTENHVTLLPAEILVYPFDPRGYCESSDVLAAGATIKPRYGFPIETKKVWRKGKMVEEVLPAKAPLAFEVPPSAPPDPALTGQPAAAPESPTVSAPPAAGAGAETTDTPPPVTQLKHVEARAFVLDETYPLEVITPLGRIESPEARAAAAAAAAPPATAPGEDGTAAESAEPARPPAPPPPPLTLTIRPLGTTSAPGSSTVTVTAKNTSGRSMRLYLRRELISYQVTGPSGPTTCRMTSSARAPSPAAYSSLGAGASLSLTTRLAEACPKGTFDHPGSYTVFARIDAQNSGREHGFVAYTGTAITGQPATLTVRGTGAQAKPVMRITSGR